MELSRTENRGHFLAFILKTGALAALLLPSFQP